MWTLVTGAGGFVGGHVTRYLYERGMSVVALQRTPRPIEGMPEQDTDRYCRLIGDLTSLPVIDMPIENIVHLAALINVPGATESDFVTGNVATTEGIIQLTAAKGCDRVVALSTVSIYGSPNGSAALSEETPISTQGAYGASKYRAELMLKDLGTQAQVTVLRTPGIVGRDANPNLVVRLCETASQDKEIRITNPDALFNSTIHVSDVCQLVEQLLAGSPNLGYDVVNLSSASPLTIRTLVETIITGLCSSSRITVEPDGTPPRLIDITRLRHEYGFEPLTVAYAVELYASECN